MLRIRVAARVLLLLAIAVHGVFLIWSIGGRFTYPYEIEWMTGSILDHIERVRMHRPVYVEPGAGFIPFLYPPLYYWVTAALGGSVVACRAVSILSTIVQAACVHRLASDLGASRLFRWVAVGIFAAAFSYVGFWYDLERCDNLLGALVLLATTLLVRSRRPPVTFAAGALLGLAFLAKQQASFYVLGATFGLLLTRRAKGERLSLATFVAFAAGGIIVGGGALAYAHATEGGAWFDYYVLRMPSAHGVLASLVRVALVPDVATGFALVVATVALVVVTARRLRDARAEAAELVFTAILAAGFGGAIASRLHIGGYVNVLIPWTTLASVAAAVVASRVHEGSALREIATPLVLVAQLAVWIYNPEDQAPRRAAPTMNAKFANVVRELEREGPVLLPPRGHVTSARHFQIAALADVVRVDGHSPAELVNALSQRTFAAILDDARPRGVVLPPTWPPSVLDDVADLRGPMLRSYFVSEWLEDELVRIQLPSPALPHWVYRPRRGPITELPEAALRARQLREMDLAFERSARLLRGEKATYDAAEIEAMAAASY